jgi:ATP adenylyltransferase/5',5'''-P-1,P-4-tetraphosphate phosphorylase II
MLFRIVGLSMMLLRSEGGDSSGASQPHKHVQFIPIEGADGPPIERIAKAVNLESPSTFHPIPLFDHSIILVTF